MTPETHKYAAAAGSFCFVTTENGRQQDIYNLTTMPCVQRSLYLEWNDRRLRSHTSWRSQKELTAELEMCWNNVWRPVEKQQELGKKKISCKKRSLSSRSKRILQTVCWSKTPRIQILGWQRSLRSCWSEKGQTKKLCNRKMGAHHQDGQTRSTSLRQRQDGYWEVSKTNRRNINRQILLLPQDPGLQMSCQMAASKSWNIFHIDLQDSLSSRTVLRCESWCCVSITTRSRSSSLYCRKIEETCIKYEWCPSTLVEHSGQSTVQLWHDSHELTDVVMCCTQLKHSAVSEPGTKRALHSGTGLMTSHLKRACDQKKMQHLRKCWIQLKEVQLQENP